MRKELRQLIEAAEKQGWRIIIAKGHVKFMAPNKEDGFVTVALTPSDHRWFDNTIARMRQRGFRWPPK